MDNLRFLKATVSLIIKEKIILFDLSKESDNDYFKAELTNKDDRIILNIYPKQAISFYSIDYYGKYNFKDEKLLLNGYQSWTYTREVNINYKDTSLKYVPKAIVKKFALDMYNDRTFENIDQKVMHGFSYSYLRENDEYYLLASLNEKNGFTAIYFDTKNNQIHFQKDCLGYVTSNSYEGLNILLIKGNENEVFDRYFSLLNIPKKTFVQHRGYTSWYNYYQNISEDILLKDLISLKKLPKKAEIFQIDDGFETYVGDWLDIDKNKFPNGLANLVQEIKKEGYKPGIWLSPFVCEEKSKLFQNHPYYVIHKDNKPLKCGSNWSGCYGLDIQKKEVREYIKKVLEYYISLGFEVFKLDFLYAAALLPLHNKNRGQIMSDGMDFLREILKDKIILGCGVPLASAFGKVDYCRIGPDISLDYDDKLFMRLMHSERPSTKHTMLNSIFRRQLNTRAFINDTDVFILRDKNTSLSLKQKKELATINCLCGGVIFASDNFATYSVDILNFYNQVTNLNYQNLKNVEVAKKNVIIKYEDASKLQTLKLKR